MIDRTKQIIRQFARFNRYLVPYWSLEALVLLIVFLESHDCVFGGTYLHVD